MVRLYSRGASAQAGDFARDWAAFLQIANGRAAEILNKRFKRDKRKASKGGRELWYVNSARGEKGGGSFSFNTEKGVAHDFVDASFDLDLIGLVCLHGGLGKGKDARLQAVRIIADELKLETPWFAREKNKASVGSEAGWRFHWRGSYQLSNPVVRENPDLCAGLDYFAARGLDALEPEYLGSLRVHGALPYYVIPGDKPIAIGPFPAILAALGEPVALQRMWLEQTNDGLVCKISEETLRKAVAQAKVTLDPDDDLPSRKLTAGGCGTAAVWMGRPTDTVVIAEGVETALSAVDAGFYAAAA